MIIHATTGTSSSGSTSSSTTTTTTSGLDDLANEQTFLKLFIAQLQNQDPLDPQDGSQFVAQLAQFSDLEQTLGMHSDTTAIKTDLENYIGTTSTTTSTTSTGSTDSTKG